MAAHDRGGVTGPRPQTPFEELCEAIRQAERDPAETVVLVDLALAKQIRELLADVYQNVEAVNA